MIRDEKKGGLKNQRFGDPLSLFSEPNLNFYEPGREVERIASALTHPEWFKTRVKSTALHDTLRTSRIYFQYFVKFLYQQKSQMNTAAPNANLVSGNNYNHI
jgi:hypothetical protein